MLWLFSVSDLYDWRKVTVASLSFTFTSVTFTSTSMDLGRLDALAAFLLPGGARGAAGHFEIGCVVPEIALHVRSLRRGPSSRRR